MKHGEFKFFKNRVSCNGISFRKLMIEYIRWVLTGKDRGLKHAKRIGVIED